jgi:tetratricopeptide (TPR) repeat protein
MVGRARELALLEQAWQRTQAEAAVHVALVVGEPGIGKSRLVDEFADRHPDAVVRRTRCLPGGEGPAISPMAEIVRAEVDELPDVFALVEPDRSAQAWMRRLLAPLLRSRPGSTESRRAVEPSEVVASWLRFSVGVASLGPRVFVFEDLHWADATALSFLAQALADRPRVPLLLVGTARPELLERAPWLGGQPNLVNAALGPLCEDEIDELVGSEVGIFDRSTVVHRAGGNPLFALELARLLREDAGIHGELPPTVRSVVTARFDTLGRQERSAVHAAALAGGRTTVGELAAMLDVTRDAVTPTVTALAARDLVRIDGDAVQFVHDVVRDVATEQVTKRRALFLHRRLAEWLDGAGEPSDSSTPVRVAWHYRHAADAARALDDPAAPALGVLAVGHLVRAADALEGVDLEAALDQLESTTGVSRGEADARVELRKGRLLFALGRWPEASAALARAVDAAHDAGDDATEVDAMTMRAEVSWHAGDIEECRLALDRCAEPLGRLPAGSGAAAILGTQAALRALTGDAPAGAEAADRAVALARTGDSAWALVRCIEARGTARALSGELAGYDDFIEALEIATTHGLSFEVCGLYGDFAALHWQGESPEASLAFSGKGLEIASERRLEASSDWLREVRGRVCFDAGRWDEAIHLARAVLGAPATRLGQAATASGNWSARIHLWRGETEEAARLSEWSLARARRHIVIQAMGPALITAALVALARSSPDEAEGLMDEYLDITTGAEAYRLMDVADVVRILAAIGRVDTAAGVVAGLDASWIRARLALDTARAVVDGASGGDVTDAFHASARRWRRYGAPFETMLALAAAGETAAARDIAADLRVPWDDAALPLAVLVPV